MFTTDSKSLLWEVEISQIIHTQRACDCFSTYGAPSPACFAASLARHSVSTRNECHLRRCLLTYDTHGLGCWGRWSARLDQCKLADPGPASSEIGRGLPHGPQFSNKSIVVLLQHIAAFNLFVSELPLLNQVGGAFEAKPHHLLPE